MIKVTISTPDGFDLESFQVFKRRDLQPIEEAAADIRKHIESEFEPRTPPRTLKTLRVWAGGPAELQNCPWPLPEDFPGSFIPLPANDWRPTLVYLGPDDGKWGKLVRKSWA